MTDKLDRALKERVTELRHYIPLPGGWEIQTKGRGSSFRICDIKTGERVNVPHDERVFECLERMAREIHAAVNTHPPRTPSAEWVRALSDPDAECWRIAIRALARNSHAFLLDDADLDKIEQRARELMK